jgi:hypothetical protein
LFVRAFGIPALLGGESILGRPTFSELLHRTHAAPILRLAGALFFTHNGSSAVFVDASNAHTPLRGTAPFLLAELRLSALVVGPSDTAPTLCLAFALLTAELAGMAMLVFLRSTGSFEHSAAALFLAFLRGLAVRILAHSTALPLTNATSAPATFSRCGAVLIARRNAASVVETTQAVFRADRATLAAFLIAHAKAVFRRAVTSLGTSDRPLAVLPGLRQAGSSFKGAESLLGA